MDVTPRLPSHWEGWEIEEPIGAGSYGEVYRAAYHGTDPSVTSRLAAVKIIRIPSGTAEAAALAHEMPAKEDRLRYYRDIMDGLRSEIRAMETLRGNGNVVELQDYHIDCREEIPEWTIYIRMELLTPLPDYLITHVPEEAWILRLGMELCHALEACEENEILHRDIKPENIMVTEDGTFRLGDFGVAKRMDLTTASLSLKGTFTYMAPEVYHGEKYDAKADQYSLGMVLYRLMNRNRDPFVDVNAGMVYFKDREESLRRRMKGESLPPPVDASPALAAVIAKACAYEPEERYGSVAELRHDLLVCAGELPGEELIAGREARAEGNEGLGEGAAGGKVSGGEAQAVDVWGKVSDSGQTSGRGKESESGQSSGRGKGSAAGQSPGRGKGSAAGQSSGRSKGSESGQNKSFGLGRISGQDEHQVSAGRRPISRRLVAILAAVILVLAGIFGAGFISRMNVAASGSCGNALKWQVSKDGILTISGNGMMDAYEVLHAAPWCRLESEGVQITEVHVDEGVTGIGDYAFRMCTAIQNMQLPESLEYIGEGAFSQCWNLPSVTIGKNVTHIGASPFRSSVNLKTITVDSANPIFDSRDHCNAVIETATNTLVAGCGQTVIPDSVTAIGEGAFSGCADLTEIAVPDSVETIADTAFEDCNEDLVILGSAGSAAEAYAAAHGFAFQEMN